MSRSTNWMLLFLWIAVAGCVEVEAAADAGGGDAGRSDAGREDAGAIGSDAGALDAGADEVDAGSLDGDGGVDGGEPPRPMLRGVNIQGAFRSSIHPGASRDQVIARVSHAITTLGFNSIRIGGTSQYGATFDAAYAGYGWSKYIGVGHVAEVHPTDPHAGEAWNFNVMALETAVHAGVSVWIDFHVEADAEEIALTLDLVDTLGVSLAGMTRDNEPYVPERFSHAEAAYATLATSRFAGMHWPAMYILPEGQPENRRLRQEAIATHVMTHRSPSDGLELHMYYEPGVPAPYDTPRGYIENAIANTATRYGVSHAALMVGEWSGKNQETFSDEELEAVIRGYLGFFCENRIDNYYQLLGSGLAGHGLWNFTADGAPMGRPNRGASVFMTTVCEP